ncbi:DUF1524 domain-containing protein [Comamonas thiooxydans]|uniref:DUF1524 domain-containing protein n=1 Tax=Comamonas thiooxydans TaxID=363952 RepID=UPI0001BB1231|nr:DUF1524 domain-containing protein [Comamonas thiooxydans]ACY32258.1 hypothetical protein CtCNB1_1512 [Comamonas thiooxydans]
MAAQQAHLWANHFERHTDEFAHAQEFSAHRNRVGGLVLLPKKINASLNDKAYSDKLEHYQRVIVSKWAIASFI